MPDPSHGPDDGQHLDPPPAGVRENVGEDDVLEHQALEVVAQVEAGEEVEHESSQMVPDWNDQVSPGEGIGEIPN